MSSILQAAESFKQKATSLTKDLCRLADIDFLDPDRNVRFRKMFASQKDHSLNEDWTFCFHGAECRFTNVITQQILEVILTNGSEVGVLDPYFLYVYCDTTEEFRQIAFAYKDNIKGLELELIDLYHSGRLRKIQNFETGLRRSLSF